MVDRGLEIIRKRMDLKNLLDQAAAKQRDLNHLNERIEKETRELQLLEMILKVDRAADWLEKGLKKLRSRCEQIISQENLIKSELGIE